MDNFDQATKQSIRQWEKPRPLYEEVARHLAKLIAEGRYTSEDFLPTEQALANQYGTSRNAVREALKTLSARGMIEAIHGRGSRVLPRYRWQLSDQLLSLLPGDQTGMLRDLMEVRRILEVATAGLAAQRATAEQLKAMQRTIEKELNAITRPEESIEYDFQFHRLLAESTNNLLLPQLLEIISNLVRRTALETYDAPAAGEEAVRRHTDILDNVAAQDAQGAREAMRRHLVDLEEHAFRTNHSKKKSGA